MKYLRKFNESKYPVIEGYNHVERNTYIHNSGLFELIHIGDMGQSVENTIMFYSKMEYNNCHIFSAFYRGVTNIEFLSNEFHDFIVKYTNRIEDIFGSYEEFSLPLIDIDYFISFETHDKTIFMTDDCDVNVREKYPDIYNQMKERLLDIGINIILIDGDDDLHYVEI